MELRVNRRWFTERSTCGILYVDSVFECFTLEPRKSQADGKPYCIPEGAYKVALLTSDHFDAVTPHVLNVPGFTAIEVHWGNYPKDTKGCTLVGLGHYDDLVSASRTAFGRLMVKLENQQDINITYIG